MGISAIQLEVLRVRLRAALLLVGSSYGFVAVLLWHGFDLWISVGAAGVIGAIGAQVTTQLLGGYALAAGPRHGPPSLPAGAQGPNGS